MNDELKTKEYLKSLETLKLADSSRLRMREELLAHARFHTVKEAAVPVKSPFEWLFLKPVQAAFAFVFVLGAGTVMYLGGTSSTTAPLATTETPAAEEAATAPETTASDSNEGDKLAVAPTPAPTTNPSVMNGDTVAFNDSARSITMKESADMTADESMMTTMLSQGEMDINEFRSDIVLREKTYRALIDTYTTEIGSDTTTELITKLDTVVTLLKDAEGKQDAEARPLLDKATALTGEIESTLSLLGTATIENGVITDIDFATKVPE